MLTHTHTHTVEWSSCSMHVMRADSETLSVREKYSGQWAAHAVSRADAVATGCSFRSVLEHCPGKLVNATCSRKTAGCLLETNDIIEMPVRTDWHRRLYSFAKIKSIISISLTNKIWIFNRWGRQRMWRRTQSKPGFCFQLIFDVLCAVFPHSEVFTSWLLC